MQRLCIKVAKMFALLFYQSERRFTFQVTHALLLWFSLLPVLCVLFMYVCSQCF